MPPTDPGIGTHTAEEENDMSTNEAQRPGALLLLLSRTSIRSRGALLRMALVVAVLTIGFVPAASASDGNDTLRIMTFNIFYGGDEMNLQNRNWCYRPTGCQETFDQVLKTIEAADADVVGLQEPAMKTRTIAERLGWHYDERMHVISRYPLVDPPGAEGLYTFIEVKPGEVAAIANTHLTATPYGPHELRDGASAEEVLAIEESVRRPEVQAHVTELPTLAAADIPVFMTADFNSPSHLDWTTETAAARDVVIPFEWPVSSALAAAGFRDSYRVVHPDPLAHPGFTWTSGGPESYADDVQDRIDWILAAGPASAVASDVVGESGGPDVGIEVDPYPSDHRAVVSEFEIDAGGMPVLVAVDARRVEVGDPLDVRFHGTAGRVALVRAGDDPGASPMASRSTDGDTDGTLTFDTGALQPGAHEAVLLGAGGEALARIPFWVVEPGATPTLQTTKSTYRVGEPIRVEWQDAYGMRLDWLSLTKPAKSDTAPGHDDCTTYPCSNQRYILYEYLDARIAGSTTFDADSRVGWGTWPLQPGNYEIRLMLDDHYRSAGSTAKFKVVR